MSLTFGTGEFGQFTPQEIEPKTKNLIVIPVESFKTPLILTHDELIRIIGQVEPSPASFTQDVFSPTSNRCECNDSLLIGDRFEETPDGIFELRAGERRNKLTNATIRIQKICKVYCDDDNEETFLICAIRCREAWGEEEKFIEISSKNYKSVFRKIRETFRDVQLSTQNADAIDEYLTRVNQRDAKGDGLNLPHEVSSLYMGWLTTNGQATYYIGKGDFYQGYVIPAVSGVHRFEIFNAGLRFREVGHGNDIIETLFLLYLILT